MEPGAFELQIFVSLIVVLGVAFVALVCELLKSHNQRLRERNVELEVRRQERDYSAAYHAQYQAPYQAMVLLENLLAAAETLNAVAKTQSGTPAPAAAATAAPAAANQATPASPSVAAPAVAAPAPAAAAATAAPAASAAEAPATSEEEKPAAANGIPRVRAPRPRGERSAVPRPARPASYLELPDWLKKEQEEKATLAAMARAAAAPGEEEEPVQVNLASSTEVRSEESVPATPASELKIEAGFHDRATLTELMKTTVPLKGVVISVGINDYQRTKENLERNGDEDVNTTLETLIRSLLQPCDFACRSSEDEYILVFPNESGPSAQRRLNVVAEKFWDFQLRSIGNVSVLLSWGAVEVHGETFADAVASASERMYQTRRNRKTVPLDSARSRRKAVNL